MEEYTNSTDTMEDVGLFDDYEAETPATEESTDELEEQETPEVDAENAKTETDSEQDKPAEVEESAKELAQTIRVKYNGEEKDISIEEATTLAQKGMNYDKVVAERDKWRDSDAIKAMNMFASMAGQSLEEYSKLMIDKQEQIIMGAESEALTQEHPDWSEDAINEVASLRAKDKLAELKKAVAKREEEQKQKELEPWLTFFDEFKEYRREDGRPEKELPHEMVQGVERGLSPTEAMLRHKLNSLEAEFKKKQEEDAAKLAAVEKNKTNKAKALPSASGVSDTPEDPFLQGLFS